MPGIHLKGFQPAYLLSKKLEDFPQQQQQAEAFKFKSEAFPIVSSKAYQLTSHRFLSVREAFKEKKTLMHVKGSGMTAQASIFPSFLRVRGVKMSREEINK